MTGLKWTRRTTAKIAVELSSVGIEISDRTVATTTKPNSLPEKPSDSGSSKLPKSHFFTHLEIYRSQR